MEISNASPRADSQEWKIAPRHTRRARDAACARARTPKPDGRRRRASDGLNKRTPLRLGRRPPLSAAAKCCTKRFASRSGRGCRRGHAGRGASRCASAQHRATHQRRATPAEHLFMLRRYEDENPQQQFRLDVMRPRRSRRARCARTAMRQWRRRQRRKLPVHSTSS